MSTLAAFAVLIAAAALLLVGLVRHWAKTPHGRLKPVFALLFRLTSIARPALAERSLGGARMDTPEEIAKARAGLLRNTAPLGKPVAFVGDIEDRKLPGAPGGELPVRIYRPPAAGSDALPLLVYCHGGGFITGSPEYTEGVTRTLALRIPAVVVSVDYRLAPEHPFPAAADDCEFALNWCFENAEGLGARSGPLTVAGDSAGGNLAAVAAQRDLAARQGRIGFQALIYPCLDATRTDRESHRAFGRGYGLTTLDVVDFWGHYAPDGVDRSEPALSPLYAKSLTGLPPALVVTAGFDVLRDEGIEYVEALRAAGVPVAHLHEPAMPHGFITMTRLCAEAGATLESIAAEVRSLPRE